jgi:hypothetical protein
MLHYTENLTTEHLREGDVLGLSDHGIVVVWSERHQSAVYLADPTKLDLKLAAHIQRARERYRNQTL